MEEVITRTKPKAFDVRIHEIDFIRGILILLVVMDHLFWCFYNFGMSWYNATQNPAFLTLKNAFGYYWNSDGRAFVRYLCLFGFTFISGISVAFSKNVWKRTGLFLLLWAALAIGSNFIQALLNLDSANTMYITIDFNIIGVVAWCTLIYALICNRSKKIWVSVALVGVLFWWIIIPGIFSYYPALTRNFIPILWDPIYSGKNYADWLPLFPYIIFFFLGAILSSAIYPTKKSLCKRFEFERPICYLGRHTLIIYFGWEIFILSIFAIANAIILR